MSKTRVSSVGNIGKRPTNVDKKPIGSFQDNVIQRDHIVNAAINEDKLADSSVTSNKLSDDVKDFIFNTQLSLTAYATGGQANATQLNKGLNIITTCAAQLDSVKLPSTANVGDRVKVINNGAKIANIYPFSGDDLGLGADTPVKILPLNIVEFVCVVANSTWVIISPKAQESIPIALTVTAAGWTTVKAFGILYSLDFGVTWFLKGKIVGDSGIQASISLTVANIITKNLASYYQQAYGQDYLGGKIESGYWGINNNILTAYPDSGGSNASHWSLDFDIELESQTLM